MQYQKIENAISICEGHISLLDQDDLKNKEIESYIVAGLVVLIVSEYEELIENLFIKRAEACKDDAAINFIKVSINNSFRSPDLSKINDTLKKFNETYLKAFKREIENSQNHAAWDSIMKARHAVVHKKGQLNLTFQELKANFLLTKEVIKNIESSLSG